MGLSLLHLSLCIAQQGAGVPGGSVDAVWLNASGSSVYRSTYGLLVLRAVMWLPQQRGSVLLFLELWCYQWSVQVTQPAPAADLAVMHKDRPQAPSGDRGTWPGL